MVRYPIAGHIHHSQAWTMYMATPVPLSMFWDCGGGETRENNDGEEVATHTEPWRRPENQVNCSVADHINIRKQQPGLTEGLAAGSLSHQERTGQGGGGWALLRDLLHLRAMHLNSQRLEFDQSAAHEFQQVKRSQSKQTKFPRGGRQSRPRPLWIGSRQHWRETHVAAACGAPGRVLP